MVIAAYQQSLFSAFLLPSYLFTKASVMRIVRYIVVKNKWRTSQSHRILGLKQYSAEAGLPEVLLGKRRNKATGSCFFLKVKG